jgi:hypothetical protein
MNASSALIGLPPSGSPSIFPGDETAFLEFSFDNSVILTGPAPFSLYSALMGPATYPYYPSIDMTVVGNVVGGGTVTATYSDLTVATGEFIGFSNLQSAIFFNTHSAGLDNIVVNETVPEPCSWFLAGTALLLGSAAWRTRAASSCSPCLKGLPLFGG